MWHHASARRAVLLCCVLLPALASTACQANAGVPAPTATATAAISGTITMNRPTPPPTLTPPAPVVRPNVNTATANELRAAFAAAGILGAADWANAIDEARPYPANDASWAKLRTALAEAGASNAVIDQIVSLLDR